MPRHTPSPTQNCFFLSCVGGLSGAGTYKTPSLNHAICVITTSCNSWLTPFIRLGLEKRATVAYIITNTCDPRRLRLRPNLFHCARCPLNCCDSFICDPKMTFPRFLAFCGVRRGVAYFFSRRKSNYHNIWAARGKSVFIWEVEWEEPFGNKSTFSCFRNLEILHGHPFVAA